MTKPVKKSTTKKTPLETQDLPSTAVVTEPVVVAEMVGLAAYFAQQVITRLDQAQALPEVEWGNECGAAPESITAIQAFKSPDGRTMRVVALDGRLYKQVSYKPSGATA